MTLRAWLVLLLAVAFAAAPLLTPGFGGYDPSQFPVPIENPPAQPAGYAFSIWGLIYLWLVVGGAFGLWRRRDDTAWDATRLPLIVSLAVGVSWLSVAQASPIWATVLIWVMLAGAIWALLRTPDRDVWLLRAPVGLYAGWLTAASAVSLGLLAPGWGVPPFGPVGWAFVALAVALVVAVLTLVRRPSLMYGVAVSWGLAAVTVRNGLDPLGIVAALAAVATLGVTVARRRQLSILALAVLFGCGPTDEALPANESGPDEFLFAWVTDSDSLDLNFLAVVDADTASRSYGEILRTLPVPTSGRTRGHHTEHRMPEGGYLLANDFGTGKTYVLDLRNPIVPAVADSFQAAGPLRSPHSFERLPNGNVLATFQNEGMGNTNPGGLAELGPMGDALRWGMAADGDRYLRPYSLAVLPDRDRVVSGSADMRGAGDSYAVQVWRLSDLRVIATIDLPPEWGAAAEPRVLSDGQTVLVTTFGCKLLRIDGLDGEDPTAELVYDFGGQSCALPVVVGDVWVQAVPDAHGLIALDVSEPGEPSEVARVTLGDDDWPHWISLAPDQRRIVVTGYAGTRHRILMVKIDPATGEMSVDSAFGAASPDRPGISLRRDEWPHGASGPGDPHGVVFSRRGGR